MNKTKVAGIVLILISLGLIWYKVQGPATPVDPPAPVAPFKVPADKPCFLVLEETINRNDYTADQRNAITGIGTDSLDAKIKAVGGTWYPLDLSNQTDFSRMPPWVGEAAKLPHPTLPWFIGAGPKTGFSQELPKTTAEINALVDKAK